jgi:hypothetical protein
MDDIGTLLFAIFTVLSPLFWLLKKKWPIRKRLLFVALTALFLPCIYFLVVVLRHLEASYWIFPWFMFSALTVVITLLLILFSLLYDKSQAKKKGLTDPY